MYFFMLLCCTVNIISLLGTKKIEIDTEYQVPSTKYRVPSTEYQYSILVPSTEKIFSVPHNP